MGIHLFPSVDHRMYICIQNGFDACVMKMVYKNHLAKRYAWINQNFKTQEIMKKLLEKYSSKHQNIKTY